jgi:uncharacterized protein YbjT (DUF2867 family)
MTPFHRLCGIDREKIRFTRMHDQIERHLESSRLAWAHLRPSQFMQIFGEVPTRSGKNEMDF